MVSAWVTGISSHYREHQQFVQVLAQQTPAVLISDYDFLQMLTAGSNSRSIVESHNQIHTVLRQITGVGGTDYSQYNFSDQVTFYSFLSVPFDRTPGDQAGSRHHVGG